MGSDTSAHLAPGTPEPPVDAVCRELRCQPGDVLEYVEDEPEPAEEEQGAGA